MIAWEAKEDYCETWERGEVLVDERVARSCKSNRPIRIEALSPYSSM